MDGVAKGYLLRLRHLLIPRRIPQLDEVNGDVDLRLQKPGALQILPRTLTEHLLRRLLLKVAGAVQHCNLLVLHRPYL